MQNRPFDMEHEEETTVDPKFQQGFNNGYLLAQNEPDLAAKLLPMRMTITPISKGLLGAKGNMKRKSMNGQKVFPKERLQETKKTLVESDKG